MNGDQNPTSTEGRQPKPDDIQHQTQPAANATPPTAAPLPDPTVPTIASDVAPSAPVDTVQTMTPNADSMPEVAPARVATGFDELEANESSNLRASALPVHEPMRWTASEASHARPSGWMGMLIGGTVVLAILVYLLTRDVINAGAIVLAGLLFGAYSTRRPQTVHYQLDETGIVIGQKRYPYNQFRSFAVEEGGQFHNIMLMPLKRFMPMLSLGYSPEQEQEIIGVLAERLPMETFRRDAMDAISRKLKF